MPEMTAVSKPKSRPPRPATAVLLRRAELMDMTLAADCTEVLARTAEFNFGTFARDADQTEWGQKRNTAAAQVAGRQTVS